jgi:hypothetical protein
VTGLPVARHASVLTRQFGSQAALRAARLAQRFQRHGHRLVALLAAGAAPACSLPVSWAPGCA